MYEKKKKKRRVNPIKSSQHSQESALYNTKLCGIFTSSFLSSRQGHTGNMKRRRGAISPQNCSCSPLCYLQRCPPSCLPQNAEWARSNAPKSWQSSFIAVISWSSEYQREPWLKPELQVLRVALMWLLWILLCSCVGINPVFVCPAEHVWTY